MIAMRLTWNAPAPLPIKRYDVFDEPSELCIVLEYMEGGMLSNLVKRDRSFSERVSF